MSNVICERNPRYPSDSTNKWDSKWSFTRAQNDGFWELLERKKRRCGEIGRLFVTSKICMTHTHIYIYICVVRESYCLLVTHICVAFLFVSCNPRGDQEYSGRPGWVKFAGIVDRKSDNVTSPPEIDQSLWYLQPQQGCVIHILLQLEGAMRCINFNVF